MVKQTETIYIPDTMANWPWPRKVNPHYKQAKAESLAWIRSFKAFSARSQYAFEKGDFGQYPGSVPRTYPVTDGLDLALLAALTYPRTSKGEYECVFF